MKTPHKHAELIHAYADGAEIQLQNSIGEWMDEKYPTWNLTAVYRIKPERKSDVVLYRQIKVSRFPDAGCSTGYVACTTELPANVEMLFDGETGELKEIELL